MEFSPKNLPLNEWLCKTYFSFLSSTITPFDLVQTATRLGYQSLCINDFDGVYGIARAYNDLNYIRTQEQSELKLNYGAEVHLQKDHSDPLLRQKTIVFNVLNTKGYQNLCKLISYTHRESKTEAYISLDKLMDFDLSGLFCIIPMRGALEYFLFHPSKLEALKSKLPTYLAVTKNFHQISDALIPKAYELAKRFDLPIIFSQDCFMLHRSDKSFHDVLLTIKNNNTLSENLTAFFPNGERSFHTKEQFWHIFKNFPKAQESFQHMFELNQQANFCLSSLKYQYPKEMIPAGYTPQSYLEDLSFKAAKERYNGHIPAKVVHSLTRELDLIEELNFADYFLTVWDIVAWARSQGILCQGRGSAANSAVCFVLGITSCDPAVFDLLFERFISKERGDPPDIDVDFEHERREEVLQYIYSRYGRKRAAMVANVITFRSKGAVRATGKALGIAEEYLSAASEALSTVIYRSEGVEKVLELLEQEKEVNLPWKFWRHFSKKLLDFPRHMGVHSGGFIISQHEIDQLVPQEPATMEGRTVIQWSKDDIEELGFFKIDCLSLGMLSAVRKCFDLIEKHHGKKFNLYDIPQDDKPTYQMIQKADTVGVFQIESRAQQEMAPRFRPKDLYDLVIQIATIRPGPLEGDAKNPLIRRRNGLEPVTYPCKEVEEILSRTMGVLVFQEQLMRIAVALGDFTAGEANELRKNIGAWNSKAFNRNLHPFMKKLFDGLKKRGLKKEFAMQLMHQMKGFAHYGFPESHAISFAFIAYASSYLKCHYPAAFYASVLNSQPMGFYSPHALLEAAKRNHVTILPLCINTSTWDHKLEEIQQKPGRPSVFAIRLGFRLVSGLREQGIESLCFERNQNGIFKNFDDFIQRTKLFKDDYIKIASTNALSTFKLSRDDAIWKCSAVPYKELIDFEDKEIKWQKKSKMDEVVQDFHSFGTTTSEHPIQILKESWSYSIKKESIKTSIQLQETPNTHVVSVFGMLISKQAPPTAKGMVFYTLEDETGFLNLVFTPQVYRKFHQFLEGQKIHCVSGILQKNQDSHSILVKTVHLAVLENVKSMQGRRPIQKDSKQKFKADKVHYR